MQVKNDPVKVHKVIPNVDLIFVNDGKVLLQLRKNTGYMDGLYSLVGGHFEVGEFALQAAVREAKEELDVLVDPRDLKLVCVMNKIQTPGFNERIFLYFQIETWQGEMKIAEPDYAEHIDWFSPSALPNNIIDYTKEVIENVFFKGINYFEHDQRPD